MHDEIEQAAHLGIESPGGLGRGRFGHWITPEGQGAAAGGARNGIDRAGT
jgi:hypothetical protein